MGLLIDGFAGGGGASTGIAMALGRSVDIAIDHDPDSIRMHKANHPKTKHFMKDIWKVDPLQVTGKKEVDLLWLSPDCTHHSNARGSRPRDSKIRGLAWVALLWAKKVQPKVMIIENVAEFKSWGPLVDGMPCPNRKGETFHRFLGAMERQGYKVDTRELIASDYGAATSRRRLFIIARSDGENIVWPEPTHADPGTLFVHAGLAKPWKTAADIIDWEHPCPSIFARKRPLVKNTLHRIARGIDRFVIKNPRPFISSGYGGGYTGAGRAIDQPLPTITAKDHNFLITPFMAPHANHTKKEFQSKKVQAFLIKYYGRGIGQGLHEPLDTVVSKSTFGLVQIQGEPYRLVDIGMRMLTPRELFRAQGFPESYIIDRDHKGKPYAKTAAIARVGNSVVPPLAAALVRANV